jgi:hypothetical protein
LRLFCEGQQTTFSQSQKQWSLPVPIDRVGVGTEGEQQIDARGVSCRAADDRLN